jgi:excisionase family DNA binding protein
MPAHDPDDLMRPREVAEIFGVRTTTIARWAREGRLTPLRTPGGHRRYRRAAILRLLATDEPDRRRHCGPRTRPGCESGFDRRH